MFAQFLNDGRRLSDSVYTKTVLIIVGASNLRQPGIDRVRNRLLIKSVEIDSMEFAYEIANLGSNLIQVGSDLTGVEVEVFRTFELH